MLKHATWFEKLIKKYIYLLYYYYFFFLRPKTLFCLKGCDLDIAVKLTREREKIPLKPTSHRNRNQTPKIGITTQEMNGPCNP